MRIDDAASAAEAMTALRALGAPAVLLKGGHLDEREAVVDRYLDAGTDARFVHARLDLQAHGTGCTLASAIAANLCLGQALPAAVEAATDYVERALRLGHRPGRGDIVVLDHFAAAPQARR
jgi:hydroxymethylpyrimidine/phosphomethylpyrimidine kinase